MNIRHLLTTDQQPLWWKQTSSASSPLGFASTSVPPSPIQGSHTDAITSRVRSRTEKRPATVTSPTAPPATAESSTSTSCAQDHQAGLMSAAPPSAPNDVGAQHLTGNPWCVGDAVTFGEPCQLETIPKSDARKCISHFFGRNKAETRDVQDEYWFRFCRKHYQHALYRDPDRYGLNQCKLVMRQLEVIQQSGQFLYVKLGLRLRSVEDQAQSLSPDDAAAPRVRLDGSAKRKKPDMKPPAAVPEWLRPQLSEWVSFDQMRKILKCLHYFLNKDGGEMPDIEILPVTAERHEQQERKRCQAAKRQHNRRESFRRLVLEREEERDSPAAIEPPTKASTTALLAVDVNTAVQAPLSSGTTGTPSSATSLATVGDMNLKSSTLSEADAVSTKLSTKRSRENYEASSSTSSDSDSDPGKARKRQQRQHNL